MTSQYLEQLNWHPVAPRLRWAFGPDEVPEWDRTRFRHDFELEYGFEKYYQADNDADNDASEMFRGDAAFYEGRYRTSPFIQPLLSGYPFMVVERPTIYPRHVEPKGGLWVLNALSKLAYDLKYRENTRFMAGTLEFANTYSPLGSFSRNPAYQMTAPFDSLENWISTTKAARFYLEHARVLRDMGDCDFNDSISIANSFVTPPHGGVEKRDISYLYSYLGSKKTINSNDVAEIFSKAFELRATFKFRNGRFETECNLSAYIFYELSLLYRNAKAVSRCEGCGASFYKTRADQKLCPGSSRCSTAASRKAKKTKGAR